MKKSIPIIRKRESEAFILGNGREQKFPLTPASLHLCPIFITSSVQSMKDGGVDVKTSKGFHVDPKAHCQLFELDFFFELVLLEIEKKYLDHDVE